MKRTLSAWALALASRLLMRAAGRLLGPRHAAWAQAMQCEMASVDSEREALVFAWGCLCAALGQTFIAARAGVAQVQHVGVLSCSAAVLAGCGYMHSAGAPAHYVGVNLLSLALALATYRLLPRQRLQADESLRAKLSFAMGAGLLLAGLGQASAGGSAWLWIGPVPVNLVWLLLPALLVASDVRTQAAARTWALGGLLLACGALTLLADALMLGLVAAMLGLRAWRQRRGALAWLALASVATALHWGQDWQVPEPSAFVDLMLLDGLEQHLALGLALAMLQLLLLWPALRHRQARQHGLVWGLLIALSLPGWLPSPLVGFGGSFIVSYLLSLALTSGNPAERADALPSPDATSPRRDPPAWRRSRLT